MFYNIALRITTIIYGRKKLYNIDYWSKKICQLTIKLLLLLISLQVNTILVLGRNSTLSQTFYVERVAPSGHTGLARCSISNSFISDLRPSPAPRRHLSYLRRALNYRRRLKGYTQKMTRTAK